MSRRVPTPAYAAAGVGLGTVLFLHGIGGNRDSFADELRRLAKSWRALAWDMPGYGASPAIAPLTFEALAQAVIAVLDAERAEKAVLVGHSLGGMIAQETAARFPQRVSGLVLFATSAVFGGRDDTFKNEFLAQRLAPLDAGKTMPEIAEELTKGLFGPHPPEAARRRAIASMAAIPAAAYRAALECIVTFNRLDDLARIACPTLVLAAEHDTLAPPKTMERMAARIPGATYRCIAGAGHLANFEQAAAFAAALDEFLATLA
ncbi:MAG TPA: alpha/beta fold hydrolase [Alphaproteobacteria bacterium]|jgi:pimeloyl-ACP methyl ester carboxylesterase